MTRYPVPSYPTHLLPCLQTSIRVATDAATMTVTVSDNMKAGIGAAKDRIGTATDDATTEPDFENHCEIVMQLQLLLL